MGGAGARAGLVTVADPLRLRARRVRLLLLGRLQEGIFPAAGAADPFLGDNERLAINEAGGLRLRLHEDRLDAERWLLYSAVSRPTERLTLSWHRGDDDGEPRVRSLFVDDVLECFAPALAEREVDRRLGEAGLGSLGGGARQRRLAAAAAALLPRARARARAADGPGRAGRDRGARCLGRADDRAVGRVPRALAGRMAGLA